MTGIVWARDPDRARTREKRSVIRVKGRIGRIGFSVEDAEEWWEAWDRATSGDRGS